MAGKSDRACSTYISDSDIPSSSTSLSRCWRVVGLQCGGCLLPATTLRFLGTFALAFGVVISSLEGSLLVREEQRYQRCLLNQDGLISGRYRDPYPINVDLYLLSTCYPYNIDLVRGLAGVGVLLLVVYILVSLLLLVAVTTERWQLCLPWAYVSVAVGVQEVLLMGMCWRLLYMGDTILYFVHIFLLAYSVSVLASVLQQVKLGNCEDETLKATEPHSATAVFVSP